MQPPPGRCSPCGAVLKPTHAAAAKEAKKKGLTNRNDIWTILNELRNHRQFNLCLEGNIPKHDGMV
uniref:Uncharacterized protein n=1 Tax=Arundo donax TaxID=35708 RepID=A0A0A8Y4B7_ARUDO